MPLTCVNKNWLFTWSLSFVLLLLLYKAKLFKFRVFFHRHWPEAELGLLQHPRWSSLIHLGCCSSPRSTSAGDSVNSRESDGSSRPDVFCKKAFLRNFVKFTGKHLCPGLFFNKVAGLKFATLLKKRLWHTCFTMNFVKFLRTPQVAASEVKWTSFFPLYHFQSPTDIQSFISWFDKN